MQSSTGRPAQPSRPAAAHHTFTGRVSGRRRERKFSQASLRRPLFTFDQHGRRWFCEVDNRSGMPVSRLFPTFLAPWYPDSSYITVNPENTAECYIDYPRMRTEKRTAINEFHARAIRFATKHGMEKPVRGKAYAEAIIEEIGTAPTAIEPMVAAEQEHPWIIGWSKRPDPRLVEQVKPKRKLISVEEEGFDFTEASYLREIQAAVTSAGRTIEKVKGVEDLERRVAEYEAAEVEAVGGVDDEDVELGNDDDDEDDLDVGTPPAQRRQTSAPDAPLVDEDEAGAIFEGIGGEDEALLDIEEAEDAAADGGRTVPVKPPAGGRRPQQASRHAARGGASGTKAKRLPPNQTGKGKTMKDGAKPVIAD